MHLGGKGSVKRGCETKFLQNPSVKGEIIIIIIYAALSEKVVNNKWSPHIFCHFDHQISIIFIAIIKSQDTHKFCYIRNTVQLIGYHQPLKVLNNPDESIYSCT